MTLHQPPADDGRAVRPGVLFAVAAVTVTAPRLALAFLDDEGGRRVVYWSRDRLAARLTPTSA